MTQHPERPAGSREHRRDQHQAAPTRDCPHGQAHDEHGHDERERDAPDLTAHEALSAVERLSFEAEAKVR